MWFRPALLAAIVVGLVASPTRAQSPTSPAAQRPDFTVQIWGLATADFDARMSMYAELRDQLQRGLTPLRVTDDPREILKAEFDLARRIRAARAEAHGGDIFSAEISSAFRQALLLETGSATCRSIADDNPGEFSYRINATYPKRRPRSTVPYNILVLLPKLPADVNYRFVGRQLILHDTRANVILDRIPDAIECPPIGMSER